MKPDAALPANQLKDIPAVTKAAQAIGFETVWTQKTQHDPFLPYPFKEKDDWPIKINEIHELRSSYAYSRNK